MSKLDTRRYDGKLDSFLYKNLPWEEYERVCTSEPCVVVCPEEKRVHKHVILAHRCIYFADFPPKNIKVAVALRDIESVQMINDLPNFLSSREQEESVHVQVRYRRAGTREKGLLTSISKRSPAILRKVVSKSRNDSTRSSTSLLHSQTLTPQQHRRDSLLSSGLTSADSMPSISSSDEFGRSQSFSGNRRPRDHQLHRKALSVSPISSRELSTQLTPSSSPSLRPRHSSSPVGSMASLPTSAYGTALGHLTSSSRRNGQRPMAVEEACPPGPLGKSGSLKTRQLSESMGSIDSVSGSKWDRIDGGVLRPLVRVQTDDHRGGKPLRDQYHHSSSPDLCSSSLSLSAIERNGLYHSSLSLSTSTGASTLSLPTSSSHSVLDQITSSNLSGEDGPLCDGERAVMDLYVLKQTTDFYHQLCRAWEDVKMRQAFGQSSLLAAKSTSTSMSHERFSQHYLTLKQEMFSSTSIEVSAQLTQELCTACQKYFVIKKLFWEDCDLLEFCLSQLNCHLSASSGGQRTSCSMNDQLEYSIIVMDLIYQMLRETHVCLKRFVHLMRNGGQLLLALASSVIHFLPVPSPKDTEGLDELTEKSCGILFELIRVTQEARWPPSRTSTVSTAWLVARIGGIPSTKDFCSRLVSYISRALTGATPPAPQTQITLHHAAFIVHTLVHNPGDLVMTFRSHFTEEFRYFISISGARRKLADTQLLSLDTLKLLHSAKSKILQT